MSAKKRLHAEMTCERATLGQVLEQLASALRSGHLTLAHGGERLELCPSNQAHVALEAKRKNEWESLRIRVEWRRFEASPDPLRIRVPKDHDEALDTDEDPLPSDTWTYEELYQYAQELGIEGRSRMTKDELIDAIAERSAR